MGWRGRHWGVTGALLGALLLSACEAGVSEAERAGGPAPAGRGGPRADTADEPGGAAGPGTVTLAFAGDVHFEQALGDLVGGPDATVGPLARALRSADLAMVNLESSVSVGGTPAAKELEDPAARYWFQTPPAALGVLARSGVDVVTVANNHGADYGAAGLRQTLAAARTAPLAVVGAGATARQAFRPHRVTIRGTDVAVLAADASRRESRAPVWAAGEGGPGLAAAHDTPARRLLSAVRRADRGADLVVVYLHWGAENQPTPSGAQRRLARDLSRAGADVVVGSHTHTLLGSGMLGPTFVGYGLGNFVWYHGRRPDTGVLRLQVRDGRVVADRWVPGRTPPDGGTPVALTGRARAEAVDAWRLLRRGTGLTALPGEEPSAPATGRRPPYAAQVARVGPVLARRMRGVSHHAGCPVTLADLRRVTVSYVGFDDRTHTGRLVVAATVTADVVRVFRRLYDAGYPIRRMRLVDAYGGDDDRSMAADNTSGYNCRRVAGQTTWSDHAYGRAIDLNPVENPYVTRDGVLPPAGRGNAGVDRSRGADVAPGVIRAGDAVTRAFARVGWTWGGVWSEPDYQHFSAP